MAKVDDRQMILNIVSRYAKTLKQEMQINTVYLYGSYSKGRQQADSDIDVAVISPDFTGDIIEDQFRLMQLRRTIDLRIEPRPFQPSEFNAQNPLALEVMETGIIVE
jgi:predicted nucleotidyltransferase